MLDFPLACGRRTYISIHELKFPELSPQFLCNNNSYTSLWKQRPIYSSLMPQSERTLEYTVLYFYIYRHHIDILYIVQWAIVRSMQKPILSTLCSLLPPKALGCSGKVSAISRSALAGMAALALAQSPQSSSNLKDSFILAICSPHKNSSELQAKVLHSPWKLLMAATVSIIYFISKVISILIFSPNCWNFSYLVYWYFTINVWGS